MSNLVMPHIEDLDQFMKWVDRINPLSESEKYLFRGLSDQKYQVEASAWRRLPSGHEANSLEPFHEINKNLIKEARLQGHDYRNGRELSDLEILAELQHFGAATCLIDFTYSAQVALWFACQQDPKVSQSPNSKVTAVLNAPGIIIEVTPKIVKKDYDYFFNEGNERTVDNISERVLYRWQPRQLKIVKKDYDYFFNEGNERTVDNISERVLYRWQPRQLNNRITSQHSVFLFGDKRVRPNEGCIIETSCKKQILNSLEKHSNIAEKTLFPDFEGFARQHGHDKTYQFPDYVTLANRAFQRREFDEALLDLNKVIELNSKDLWHYYRRAHVKYYLGMNNSSLDYLNEANEDLQSSQILAEETGDKIIMGQIQMLRQLIQKAYDLIHEPC